MVCLFSGLSVIIIPSQSHKHGNMTFPLDGVTFALYGEGEKRFLWRTFFVLKQNDKFMFQPK